MHRMIHSGGNRHRRVLETLGGWRYRTRFYHFPYELRAMFKYISYRRPELEGL